MSGSATMEPDQQAPPSPLNGTTAPANGTPSPAPSPPLTDEERRKAAAFDLVGAAEREVAAAAQVLEEAKAAQNAAKKEWDYRSQRLHELIAKHRDPAPMPLFDKKAPGEIDEDGEPGQPHPGDSAEWRATRLEHALRGVSEAVIQKLNAANLFTMGDLSDWTSADGGRNTLADIKGIGGATLEKIDNALMAFWARLDQERREAAPTAAPESNGQPNAPTKRLNRDELILIAIASWLPELTTLKETGATDGQIRLALEPALDGARSASSEYGDYAVADKKLTICPKGEQDEAITMMKLAKAVRRIVGIPQKADEQPK